MFNLKSAWAGLCSAILISNLSYAEEVGHVPVSQNNSILIHSHTTQGLKPISDSYKLARLQYLPELTDSENGWAGNKLPTPNLVSDKCSYYPLTSCPAGGNCTKCPFGNRYKLNSCRDGWRISGNSCIAASCSALNKSYLSDIPSNQVCSKVTEGGLTCYKDCRAVSCDGYKINCDNGVSGSNISSSALCPDCMNDNAKCSPKLCKITACVTNYKTNADNTACVEKDDTCPDNYFKTCETSVIGDPKYTERGTACYQCKAKEPETCSKYVEVNFPDYTRIGSSSDLQHALIDGKNNFVVVNDFTIDTDIDLSGKTIMGANEIASASHLCANTPKITVQGKTQIKTSDATEFKKLNFINKIEAEGDCGLSAMISGGGTFRDFEFTFTPEKQITRNRRTPHMEIRGIANFYNVKSIGYKHFCVENGSTLNVKGRLEAKKDTLVYDETDFEGWVIGIYGNNPIVNIEKGASVTYHGASSLFAIAAKGVGEKCQASDFSGDGREHDGILNIDGSVTHTFPGRKFRTFDLTYSTININYPSMFIGVSASRVNINAATTIDANYEYGVIRGITYNYDYPSKVNINAPLNVINAKAFDKDLDWDYNDDSNGYTNEAAISMNHIYINSDVTFDNKVEFVALIGPDTLTFGPKANVKGPARWIVSSKGYSALKSVSYSSGAKLEIGGVCKKATSSGSFNPDTKSTTIWKTPQSPFTGGC